MGGTKADRARWASKRLARENLLRTFMRMEDSRGIQRGHVVKLADACRQYLVTHPVQRVPPPASKDTP